MSFYHDVSYLSLCDTTSGKLITKKCDLYLVFAFLGI